METQGHKRLRRWFSRSGLTYAELAERAGISRVQLSQLIHGRRRASLVVAVKLARATDDAVPVGSWVKA